MANDQKVQILIEANDRSKEAFSSLEANIRSINKSLKALQTSTQHSSKEIIRNISAIGSNTSSFREVNSVTTRLTSVLNTAKENIKSFSANLRQANKDFSTIATSISAIASSTGAIKVFQAATEGLAPASKKAAIGSKEHAASQKEEAHALRITTSALEQQMRARAKVAGLSSPLLSAEFGGAGSRPKSTSPFGAYAGQTSAQLSALMGMRNQPPIVAPNSLENIKETAEKITVEIKEAASALVKMASQAGGVAEKAAGIPSSFTAMAAALEKSIKLAEQLKSKEISIQKLQTLPLTQLSTAFGGGTVGKGAVATVESKLKQVDSIVTEEVEQTKWSIKGFFDKIQAFFKHAMTPAQAKFALTTPFYNTGSNLPFGATSPIKYFGPGGLNEQIANARNPETKAILESQKNNLQATQYKDLVNFERALGTQGKKIWNGHIESSQQATRNLKALNSEMNRLNELGIKGRNIFSWMTGGLAAYQLYRAMRHVVDEMINYNRLIEISKVGISAILASTTKVYNAQGKLVEGAERYKITSGMALQVQWELRKAALQSVATYEQLVDAYQGIVGSYVSAQKGNKNWNQILKESVDLTVTLSNAVLAIGLPFNQIKQEARDLINSGIQPQSSHLATALGITDKMVKKWREAGTIYEELTKRTQGFVYLQNEVNKTWVGAVSNLKDVFQLVVGEGFKSLFMITKDTIMKLMDSLVIFKEEFDVVTKTKRIIDVQIRPEVRLELMAFSKTLVDVFKLIRSMISFVIRYGDYVKGVIPLVLVSLLVRQVQFLFSGLINLARGLTNIAAAYKQATLWANLFKNANVWLFVISGVIALVTSKIWKMRDALRGATDAAPVLKSLTTSVITAAEHGTVKEDLKKKQKEYRTKKYEYQIVAGDQRIKEDLLKDDTLTQPQRKKLLERYEAEKKNIDAKKPSKNEVELRADLTALETLDNEIKALEKKANVYTVVIDARAKALMSKTTLDTIAKTFADPKLAPAEIELETYRKKYPEEFDVSGAPKPQVTAFGEGGSKGYQLFDKVRALRRLRDAAFMKAVEGSELGTLSTDAIAAMIREGGAVYDKDSGVYKIVNDAMYRRLQSEGVEGNLVGNPQPTDDQKAISDAAARVKNYYDTLEANLKRDEEKALANLEMQRAENEAKFAKREIKDIVGEDGKVIKTAEQQYIDKEKDIKLAMADTKIQFAEKIQKNAEVSYKAQMKVTGKDQRGQLLEAFEKEKADKEGEISKLRAEKVQINLEASTEDYKRQYEVIIAGKESELEKTTALIQLQEQLNSELENYGLTDISKNTDKEIENKRQLLQMEIDIAKYRLEHQPGLGDAEILRIKSEIVVKEQELNNINAELLKKLDARISKTQELLGIEADVVAAQIEYKELVGDTRGWEYQALKVKALGIEIKQLVNSADFLKLTEQQQMELVKPLVVKQKKAEDIQKGTNLIDWGFTDAITEWGSFNEQIVGMAKQTATDMQGAFSDFFFDFMTDQLKTWQDYVMSIIKSIAGSLSQILSKQLVAFALEKLGLTIDLGPLVSEAALRRAITMAINEETAALWLLIAAKKAEQAVDLMSLGTNVAGGTGGNGSIFGDMLSAFFSGGKMTPNAKGGVYPSSSLKEYTNTIVTKPTVFAFAKGAGLMGEEGSEAIMPLSRTSNGELGVKALIGKGDTTTVNSSVVVNVDSSGNTSTSSQTYDSGMAKQLGNLIDAKVTEVILKQKRPGGLLSGT